MHRVNVECTSNARRVDKGGTRDEQGRNKGGCAEYGRDYFGTRSGQPRDKVEMTVC